MSRVPSHYGRSATEPNARSFTSVHALPHSRGLQPPPTDPKKLRRELTRLNWALHCLNNERATLVKLLDRKEQLCVRLRRQRDEYANALQDLDPECFELAEQERRDMDNPRRALEWACGTKGGGE